MSTQWTPRRSSGKSKLNLTTMTFINRHFSCKRKGCCWWKYNFLFVWCSQDKFYHCFNLGTAVRRQIMFAKTIWYLFQSNRGIVAGLQIISWLAPVKLSGQTYFCSDISHFWPDKHRLRLIAIKVPPHPFTWCLNMKQVNFQSIYCTWASISMQEKWNAWYSKICITFVRTTIASVLRLIYS